MDYNRTVRKYRFPESENPAMLSFMNKPLRDFDRILWLFYIEKIHEKTENDTEYYKMVEARLGKNERLQ